MKNMTLRNIADACFGQLVCKDGQEQYEIKGAVLDSRLVEEGYLFFATKGERVDGHSFIPQVAEKKAACVICEKAPENTDAFHKILDDTLQSLNSDYEAKRTNNMTLNPLIINICSFSPH